MPSTSSNPEAARTGRALLKNLSSGASLILIMACALVTAITIAGVGGAVAGQNDRNLGATATTEADLTVQYDLALRDIAEGRTALGAERLYWILERAPEFPGAREALAQAQAQANGTAADEAAPAIAPSDSGDVAQIYAEAEGYFNAGEWKNAIFRLEELRTIDSAYRAVDVQEMLFTAQTELGQLYLRGNRIEEGILLLEQAAELQPLSDQLQGEIFLASRYQTAQSYWGLDWNLVVQNLEAIYEVAPNYRADLGDDLFEARSTYGEILQATGAYCDAQFYYESALELKDDPGTEAALDEVEPLCASGATPLPGATQQPSDDGTPQPTSTPDSGYQGIPTLAPRPTEAGE